MRKNGLDALLEEMNQAPAQGPLEDTRRKVYPQPENGDYSPPEVKGTELEQNGVPSVVIPASDLVPPPPSGPQDAEFFKEGEVPPVTQEVQNHEFFKEAPQQYEMRRASDNRPATVKKIGQAGLEHVTRILSKYGYTYTGMTSKGTALWHKGQKEWVEVDLKTWTWEHFFLDQGQRHGDTFGRLEELEDKISLYHNFERPGAREPVMASAKPKCPHCGSSDYGLMPTDFETAKCNDCGKNWDHGIVPGINDPKDASTKTAAVLLPPLKVEDLRAIGSGKMSVDEWKKKEPQTAATLDEVFSTVKKAHANAPDSGAYDEKAEAHTREEAGEWAMYAEPTADQPDIKPYDPAGKYFCGTCDMRMGEKDCQRVEGPISFEQGSCRMYHRGEPEDKTPMEKKFSKEDAKYGENAEGFGCVRCEYGAEAKTADSEGRKSWCSFWGMHILPTACCAQWEKGDKEEKNAGLVQIAGVDHNSVTLYRAVKRFIELDPKNAGVLRQPLALAPDTVDYELYELSSEVLGAYDTYEKMRKSLPPISPESFGAWQKVRQRWGELTRSPEWQSFIKARLALRKYFETMPEPMPPYEDQRKREADISEYQLSVSPSKRKPSLDEQEEKLSSKTAEVKTLHHGYIPNNPLGMRRDTEFFTEDREYAGYYTDNRDPHVKTEQMEVGNFFDTRRPEHKKILDEMNSTQDYGIPVDPANGVPFYLDAGRLKEALIGSGHYNFEGLVLSEGGGKVGYTGVSYARFRNKHAAANKMYHVTRTSAVPLIKKKGIIQTFQSNWDQGTSGERYGEGEIFAFTDPTDAVRWAGKMGWEHYQSMGDGKISVVVFSPTKDQKWEVDTNDSVSQAGAKGQWMKMIGRVAPEQITAVVPVTQEMIRAVIQNKSVKLGASSRTEFEALYRKWKAFKQTIFNADAGPTVTLDDIRAKTPKAIEMGEKLLTLKPQNKTLFEDAGVTFRNTTENVEQGIKRLKRIPAMLEEIQGEWAHRSEYNEGSVREAFSYGINDIGIGFHNLEVEYFHMDAPRDERGRVINSSTKSYGMGTPIGGTPNGGAPDDPEADEEENAKMDMTASAQAMDIDFCTMTAALSKIASSDSVGWWAKSARPTDQKIQLLQKQFKVTPEQIELCVQADPSANQTDYVAWLAKWLSKGQLRLPEDTEKVKKQLGLFQKLKKSPAFQGNKDVQQYDPAALFKTVEENAASISKKEKQRQVVRQGTEIVVEDGDLTIYKVTDPTALMELSGGTNWCTAHKSHSSRYLKDGPSYVFFKNDSAFAQLHPASDQLMNRQDVCMVEEMEDTTGKEIAKFVSDPTAMKGLRALSKIEPNVAKWVKENATEPGTVAEILGRKMTEEQAKGEEQREMTVRHAMAVNKALPAEQEARLPQQVDDIGLLFKYGEQFHARTPWKPLEQVVLAGDCEHIVAYAQSFIGGRWPKGESKIIESAFSNQFPIAPMIAALDYAANVLKGRWEAFEKSLHATPLVRDNNQAGPSKTIAMAAAKYAIYNLKQRWTQVVPVDANGISHEEDLIKNSPKWWNEYSKQFMPQEFWDGFREHVVEATSLDESGYQPQHDLWVVREWENIEDCVRSIGDNYADEALDYALAAEREEDADFEIPSVAKMSEEISSNLSFNAMKRIGQSLQEEEPILLSRWAQQNDQTEIDFGNPYVMESVLIYTGRYNPECSVWKNIIKAYQEGTAAQYAGRRIGDLEFAINDVEEMMSEDGHGRELYTELRFGPQFETRFHGDWKTAPVYEVINRDGAVRLMEDMALDEERRTNQGYRTKDWDLSDGQIRIHVMEVDQDADRDDNKESYELMDTWYTSGLPQQTNPDQMPLQFTGSLLKKRSLVEMHETPTMLPPRDDVRRHIDEQEQDQVMEGVMDGVTEPVPAQKRQSQQKQIDPNLNPNGESNYDPTLMMNPSLLQPLLAAAEEGEIVSKRKGNWKLYAFSPDTPLGQYGEIKRPVPEHQTWYVGDKAAALPIIQDNWGPISHEQENELLRVGALNLPDVLLRLTAMDYDQPIALPKKNPVLEASKSGAAKVTAPQIQNWLHAIPDFAKKLHVEPVAGALKLECDGKAIGYLGFPLDELMDILSKVMPEPKDDITWDSVVAPKWYHTQASEDEPSDAQDDDEEAIDEVRAAEHEAYQVFLNQDYLQQEAQDRNITMRQLWDEMKMDFLSEYFQTSYSEKRQPKIGPEGKRGSHPCDCPKCKKANVDLIDDPRDLGPKLGECRDCGLFFTV